MLTGGPQRRALLLYQNEEMKILYISFPQLTIESTTSRTYSHTLVETKLMKKDNIAFTTFYLKTIQVRNTCKPSSAHYYTIQLY